MNETVYQDLSRIFAAHFKEYPKAQPIDCIKLCYQRAFGAAHFCGTPKQALDALAHECAALNGDENEPLVTAIGGGAVRVSLRAALARQIPLPFLARFFCLCAVHTPHKAAWFSEALDMLALLCAQGVLPFAPEHMREVCETYRADGCPPVSHSEEYRAAYAPHYRVLAGRAARLFELALAAEQKLAQAPETVRVAVALDGFAGAGKSTAAGLLSELFGTAPVVAMDDFFLPADLRTPQRFAEPGGNVHYERFAEEVSPFLRGTDAFSYRRFDCSRMDYGAPREIPSSRLVFVEGSYALHPFLRAQYDLTAFFDIEPAEQQSRILQRSGEAMLRRFVSEWIPMERAYEAAFRVKRHADFVICTGGDALDTE